VLLQTFPAAIRGAAKAGVAGSLILLLSACSVAEAPDVPTPERPAAQAPAAEPEPVPVPDGPMIRGVVRFDGNVPETAPAAMAADVFCAGSHDGPVLLPAIDVDAGGGLRNAIVHVVGAAPAPPPDREALMDQRGCIYEPRVLAVRAGQTVVFRNSDDTLHNVNVRPRLNDAFNVGQPVPGMETRKVFAAPEEGIPVRCDVHPWMLGFISVFDHPWFAVTGDGGEFTLYGLTEGTHVLEVWHEKLGTQTREVTVEGDETAVELVWES
jgi:plastocyanin